MTAAAEPLLGAHLAGYPAVVFAALIRPKIATALEALERAGRQRDAAAVRHAWRGVQLAERAHLSGPGPSDHLDSDIEAGSGGEWLTVAEVASRLGVTERHTRRLIARGQLDGRRPGWSWQVSRSSVDMYRVTREVA